MNPAFFFGSEGSLHNENTTCNMFYIVIKIIRTHTSLLFSYIHILMYINIYHCLQP